MEVDIRASIAAALDSRRSQQEPIARLHRAWRALNECVEQLTVTITRTGGQFASLGHPTSGQLTVVSELEAERNAEDLQQLRHALTALTPDIEAIERRVNRKTVNIGVIGRAQAGKSTLLRTITQLGPKTIPSTSLNPTTAARSRILHSPGRADAEITLLTWDEFRDGYLAPLHREAGRDDPVPPRPDDFASYPYRHFLQEASRSRQDSESEIIQQKFLKRLCVAQESFMSYRDLLTGPTRQLDVELPDLRPYVAYPENENDRRRPYHAVRDVRIYCPFPGVDVENLALVDLPGAGEAGLDIDRQFLRDLKNEVDVLLQVKRPTEGHAFFEEQDWDVLKLADEARMGVQVADFVSVVINSDPPHVAEAALGNAVAKAREIADRNGFRLLAGDVADVVDVRDYIFGPVLEGLADRLAAMDRAAAGAVVARTSRVAEQVMALADQMAGQVRAWARHVPNEEKALDGQAKRMRNDVALSLKDLRRQYDQRVRDREPVPELGTGIAQARDKLTKWAAAGFGLGSEQTWLAAMESALAADPGEARDDQCTVAREKIRAEFSQIDSTLSSVVARLHQEVADALRKQLTVSLVPASGEPLVRLLDTARERQLVTLCSALEELVQFRANYGNIFLRAGGPVVRGISPERGLRPGVPAAPAPAQDRAAEPSAPLLRNPWKVGKVASAMSSAGAPPEVVAGAAAAAAVVAVAPVIAELIGQVLVPDDSSAGLHKALTHAFGQAVTEIEKRMRNVAGELTEVLAALIDKFYDNFTRTPGVEKEFVKLCEPMRHELWPELFDGRAGELASGLTEIAHAASGSSAAAREILAAAAGIRPPAE